MDLADQLAGNGHRLPRGRLGRTRCRGRVLKRSHLDGFDGGGGGRPGCRTMYPCCAMCARCSCICSSAERCQAAISVRRSSTSSRVIIRRPVHHVVPTTVPTMVRMTAVAAIQVCRFCRSMPCARLFRLLRETAPSPTASGGSGRRPALGLRGRRRPARTRRATGATRCRRCGRAVRSPSPSSDLPPGAGAGGSRIRLKDLERGPPPWGRGEPGAGGPRRVALAELRGRRRGRSRDREDGQVGDLEQSPFPDPAVSRTPARPAGHRPLNIRSGRRHGSWVARRAEGDTRGQTHRPVTP